MKRTYNFWLFGGEVDIQIYIHLHADLCNVTDFIPFQESKIKFNQPTTQIRYFKYTSSYMYFYKRRVEWYRYVHYIHTYIHTYVQNIVIDFQKGLLQIVIYLIQEKKEKETKKTHQLDRKSVV